MSIRMHPVLTANEARQLSPLQLAYLGDTVWEMLVRQRLLFQRENVRHMHKDCVSAVNANAQGRCMQRLLPSLTEEETDVFHRGRNAHARHPVPKNQNPEDYALATGLEAVFGFLYVTGRDERIAELFTLSREEETGHA